MGLAHVSSNGTVNASGTTVSVTFTPGQAGNLLVVSCRSHLSVPSSLNSGASGEALQISDSNGNLWESAIQQVPLSNLGAVMRVFYCRSCAAGSTTVTIACANGGAQSIGVWVDEFSGHSSSPLDQVSFATGSSASLNSGSQTPSSANSIVFGFLSGATAVTKGGTYTQNTAAGTSVEFPVWKIVSSASSYSVDGTMTSGAWGALMVTFSDQVIIKGITHVNVAGKGTTATSTSMTLTYQPTSGNLLLITTWMASPATGAITLADSNGNVIVAIDGPTPNSNASGAARTWYIASALAGGTTFTATYSSTSVAGILIDEFDSSNAPGGPTWVIDQHGLAAITSGTAGAFTSPVFTTTSGAEVVWGTGMAQANTSVSAPFTLGTLDGKGTATAYQIVSSIQTAQSIPFVDSNGTGQADLASVVTFSLLSPVQMFDLTPGSCVTWRDN